MDNCNKCRVYSARAKWPGCHENTKKGTLGSWGGHRELPGRHDAAARSRKTQKNQSCEALERNMSREREFRGKRENHRRLKVGGDWPRKTFCACRQQRTTGRFKLESVFSDLHFSFSVFLPTTVALLVGIRRTKSFTWEGSLSVLLSAFQDHCSFWYSAVSLRCIWGWISYFFCLGFLEFVWCLSSFGKLSDIIS